MKLPVETMLATYRTSLTQWKSRNGLNGGGGAYIRTERKYGPAPEPEIPQGLSPFEKKLFLTIRAEVLK